MRGWDSNPRSRAHEAREDNRSSTAQSGWQESNLRSPAPEAGGVATLPYSQKRTTSTPGGIRTRSFRVENPASSPFRPQGQGSSGGRARTCLSRLTAARLANSTTPERTAEAAGLEPANGSEAVCAVATRCLSNSAMPPRGGRRGSRTPKAREPTRFRDGIPRRWQSFQVTPAGVEPAPSRVRTGSSAELSYGAVM